MNDTTTAAHPAVSKIRIEYADGSHDEMELLDAAQVLYSWDRKRPTGKTREADSTRPIASRRNFSRPHSKDNSPRIS